MSLCKREGKDIIIFATKEDHDVPSKISLPEPEPQPGLILPNGDINWGCPCLGGMATGPCGVEFREAFSCFHYSEADPKGSDCFEAFSTMQTCMQQYPTIYSKYDTRKEDGDDEGGDESQSAIAFDEIEKSDEANAKPIKDHEPDKLSIEANSTKQ